MIFTILVVGFFVFKAPAFIWVSIPICFGWFVLKDWVMSHRSKDKKTYIQYDEFDWWQDNQGL